MKNFHVTVIVPIYNVQDYILECLISITHQHYEGFIQCILVDDCGNDNSIKIVEKFISEYHGQIKFKLVHHEYNKGLSAARNTAIKEADGDYLFFLDSDDTITPNCIEILVGLASKYPNVDIVQSSLIHNGNLWTALGNKDKIEFSDNVDWIRDNLCDFHIPDPACNRLVRKDFITENHIYFAEGFLQEDTIWSYDLQKYIKSIAFCYEPTYIYRVNPNSIMNTNTGTKEAASFVKVCNYVFRDMIKDNHTIMPREIKYLELNALRVLRTGGEDSLNLLCAQNNPLFRFLMLLNSKTFTNGYLQRVMRKICGILKIVIRLLLCNKTLFILRLKDTPIV